MSDFHSPSDFHSHKGNTMRSNNIALAIVGVFGLVVLIGICMWAVPNYSGWQQRHAGEAELARAEQSRKSNVAEAQAFKESAALLADAEVIRAEGVAKANKIIGDSLHNNEGYLRYLWINNLEKGNQVIYVPTEAGLPILEAGKRERQQ